MPPRLIQWQPVDAFDEVVFVPREGREASFERRASELGLAVSMQEARIYAPGTNIDGGWIEVGDAVPVAHLRDGSVEDHARAAAELVDVAMPTRFLISDYDGWRAIHTDEDIEIRDVADWREHLAAEAETELLVQAVTEGIVARGKGASAGDLEDLEALVRIARDQPEPYLLLGRLYATLARDEDAERTARAMIALDVRDYRKAPAHALLGELAARRGDVAAALAEHRRALALHHGGAAQLAVGVAALRANEPALAREMLAHRQRGRALFETAEALCKLGRIDDAHAYLDVALDLDRALLSPVPENQWPKPPDTAWTAAHPALAAIVEAARAAGGTSRG